MNREQFEYWLDNAPKKAFIIRIAKRHFWQPTYDISNEFFYYDFDIDRWCWDSDWWEGEEDVKYLGFISLDELPVGIFKKLGGD